MILYDIGLPLSDWLGFLGSSLGPSLSLPVVFFPPFRMTCTFPMYACPRHVVQACVYFPVGGFCGLALGTSAAMRVGMHMSFLSVVSLATGPRMCAQILGHHCLRFLRPHSAVPYSGC